MPDLSERSIAAWMRNLPADVLSAVRVEGEEASEGSGGLVAALADAAPWQVPDVVRQHAQDARAFGRARRLRLMAWVAKQTYPDSGGIFRRLTGEDQDEGAVGGEADVGVLFLEDIKAYVEAIAPRLARRMASEATMESVVQAAFTLESDMAFRQGGV